MNPYASLAFRVAAPGSVGRAVINSLCPLSAECLRAGGDRRVCVCDRSVYVRVAVWRYVRAVCMYVLCRRMYVYVTDREGQPQGRCLSRVSCVRRSAVLGSDPACLSSPHIRHSIIYSERAAPRKGRSVTRGQRTHERHTPSVSNQWPRGPTPEPYAAAAPLGPAARSRVRGADSLAQALDLLANPHRIVDDRRLGDQTRVV